MSESTPRAATTMPVILRLERAAAVAVVLCFVLLCVGEVLNLGLCCADDAMFASVAKNFARGLGYSSSLQPHSEEFRLVPFDVDITVGPTVILPAAALIKLFGNRYWVPGASAVLLWSTLLLLAWMLLRRRFGPRLALPGTAIFFACSVGLFALQFEQWYALFGEIPAACFLLLSALALGGEGERRNAPLLAGVMAGLAAVTKLLASIYLLPLVAVILVRRKPLRDLSREGIMAAAGFAAPLAAVELWKLISLGPRRYEAMLMELVGFVHYAGVANATQVKSSAWALAAERAGVLAERFGPWALAGAAGALVLAAWASFRGPPAYRRTLAFLAAGIAVNLAYWFFVSSGWARYVFMAAMLLAAMLALMVFAGTRRTALPALAMAALIVIPNFGRLHRDGYGVGDGIHALFSPGPASRPAAAQRAADFLLHHRNRAPFPTLWFATIVDMEYLLPGAVNFEMLRYGLPRCDQAGCTIAENRIFRIPNRWYETLLKRCSTVFEADPYVIYSCPPR